MPKEYKQKCREAWLKSDEFKAWLRKDDTDDSRIYCSYCKTTITAKLSDLRAHAGTKKHTGAMSGFQQKNKIDFVSLPVKTVEREAALCLFIAQHTAMAQVDHLGDLCCKNFDSGIKLHRTKCTSIIKKILAPHFFEDLCSDIGESKYSILLDESTDICVTKLLGVAINYFSFGRGVFVSTFLNVRSVEFGNASCIAEAVKSVLKEYKLDIKNLIGIGTDNANVMVGTNKSVYTELKKEAPSLILIKCVCHSVQLAVSHVCKHHLPDSLEFLIYETYNWFSKSSSRQIEYKKIYKRINDDKVPLKIPKVSDTRWLSIELAVTRILDQWEELSLHFSLAASKEKCHKANILHLMFKDDINYLYLLFLKPILKDLQKVNKCFQSNNTNATQLLNDLEIAINSLKSGIIPHDVEINIFQTEDFEKFVDRDIYKGYDFEKKLKALNIDPDSEKELRDRCSNFLIELIRQLKQRLPDNFEILKQIDVFSVENILRAKKNNITKVLEYFNIKNISDIERQFENINFIKWENVTNTINFWKEVYAYKDSGGNRPFLELSMVAIQMLSLPWSNAEIERVFSQVNLVKSKLRNRMNLSTLNSILYIRYGLRRLDKCCFSYELPKKYLNMIGTNTFYEKESEADICELINVINLL